MSVVELGLLIDTDMSFFLHDDQQIANEVCFCRLKSNFFLWNSLTSSKNCDKKYKESTNSKFVRKNDRR